MATAIAAPRYNLSSDRTYLNRCSGQFEGGVLITVFEFKTEEAAAEVYNGMRREIRGDSRITQTERTVVLIVTPEQAGDINRISTLFYNCEPLNESLGQLQAQFKPFTLNQKISWVPDQAGQPSLFDHLPEAARKVRGFVSSLAQAVFGRRTAPVSIPVAPAFGSSYAPFGYASPAAPAATWGAVPAAALAGTASATSPAWAGPAPATTAAVPWVPSAPAASTVVTPPAAVATWEAAPAAAVAGPPVAPPSSGSKKGVTNEYVAP